MERVHQGTWLCLIFAIQFQIIHEKEMVDSLGFFF